jgi:hypothetical protein
MVGGIYLRNGKDITEVKRIVDSGDGYIRVEMTNGSIQFIHKSEIDRITIPVEEKSK